MSSDVLDLERLKENIARGKADRAFRNLYGDRGDLVRRQAGRYASVLDRFGACFGRSVAAAASFFSAPGRCEIGGNHTDHNHGRILAAAIHLDTIAFAEPTDDNTVTIYSEGYDRPFVVHLADLSARPEERGTSNALVRGVAARLRDGGRAVGGFRAFVASDVAVGSGLSSSAAFEVLIATILDHFYNRASVSPREKALAGQWAENHYFGKPSGLMDQTTSAVGGFVTIDFARPTDPEVRRVEFDLARSGLALVVTDTGASHADLTGEYASVQEEMRSVARELGADSLRQTSRARLLERVAELRSLLGDRAILRSLHFFDENERVALQVEALESNDVEKFLALVNASGRSSWMMLQNCYVAGSREQGVALALALSEKILEGRGAWRVHGGGFAGTILAIVPLDLLDRYVEQMNAVFGERAARTLHVRTTGACRVALP